MVFLCTRELRSRKNLPLKLGSQPGPLVPAVAGALPGGRGSVQIRYKTCRPVCGVAGAGPGPAVPMVAGAVPGGWDLVRVCQCLLRCKLVGRRCRLAAFFFAGRPAAVAVNADSQGKSFDWCVFVWFVFALLARDSLAGGCERGPGWLH